MFVLLTLRAFAADQHLVYDLAVDGQIVGTREVTVRYYPRANGERRVVESVTHVQLLNKTLDARTVGQSNPRGATFSTAVTVNGDTQHIQGIQDPRGDWRLELLDGKTVTQKALSGVAGVTSIDLVDPGRTALVTTPGAKALVFAETGDTLYGTVGDGLAATVTVAGTRLPVTRYGFTAQSGAQAHFDVDAEGVLVASEVSWLGVPMSATLRAVPALRSFETIDTIEGMGTAVGEGAL